MLRIEHGFPQDGRLWRPHWVGPIVAKPSGDGAMVVICAVPYLGSAEDTYALSDWRNYKLSELSPVRLDAGMFPELSLAALWVDGFRMCGSLGKIYKIRVDFSAEAPFFAPREKIRDKAIIPREVYRLDCGDNLSKILVFPIASADSAKAVIPCSEIFRFYYGSSTRLANALLDGTWLLHPRMMIGPNSAFDKYSGHAYLEIGPYQANEDFRELARLQFSDIAGSEAKSLVLRAANPGGGKEYCLMIRPPFVGSTDLTVRGIRYDIGSTKMLLVLEILTCSGPWPFKTLEYGRAAGTHGASDQDTEYAGTFRRTSATEIGESVKIVQGENPGSKEIPLDLPGPLSPDRYKTPINATYRDSTGYSKGARRYDAIATHKDRFAMGAGRPESTAREATITGGEKSGLTERLAAFIQALHALERLMPDGAPMHVDVYNLPSGGNGALESQNAPTWTFIDSYKRQQPRHVVIARLSRRFVRWILFDVEQRVKKIRSEGQAKDGSAVAILRSPFARAVSNSEIQRLLATIVETRGTVNGKAWAKTEFSDWRHATLKHMPGEDTKVYARRIQAAMTRARMQFESDKPR